MKKVNRSIPYDQKVLDRLHDLQLEMIQDLASVCDKYDLNYFAVFGTALGAERHKGFIPWDDDIDVGMLRKDYDIFLKVVEKELSDKYRILTPEIDSRYACNVTKLQRKGTVFISRLSDKMECEQCIFVDIFPFDCVAPDVRQAKKQQLMTLFWDRLLYLCGSPNPVIPYKGIMYILASTICWCVHYFTKILHISPRFVYEKYVRWCTKYNHMQTPIVTSFGEAISLRYRMSIKNMFPVQKANFENIKINVLNNNIEHLEKTYGDYMKLPPENERINHAPYIIQFENEDKIINE